MTSSKRLRTLVLAGAGVLLLGTVAQAGPIPTHLSTMKSMVEPATTEVQWRGGWRGGYGYRGYGYRGLGYGVAGAVVGGAIARSAYYGGYGGGYYGGYYGGGYPAYSYSYTPAYGYGYGYGGDYCAPSGSYAGYW